MERTHSWLNAVGKLRRCTKRRAAMADQYLIPDANVIVIQQLLRAAFHPWR